MKGGGGGEGVEVGGVWWTVKEGRGGCRGERHLVDRGKGKGVQR